MIPYNSDNCQPIFKSLYTFKQFLALFALFIFVTADLYAQGNLMIYPKRLLFDGTKKIQQLNLINSGTDTAVYVISVIYMQISDSGRYDVISVPDSSMNTAEKYIHIYPKKVIIPPDKAQVVKVQLSNYTQLMPGEYRSHIYLRAIPAEHNKSNSSVTSKDTSAISIQIQAIFGFTVPVIIRSGVSDVKIGMTNLSLQNDNEDKWLNFTINREGNISAYGEVIVNLLRSDGTETQVGYAKGLAVYHPNTKRICRLKLSNDKDNNYNGGKLHIIYKNLEKSKADILAEAHLEL